MCGKTYYRGYEIEWPDNPDTRSEYDVFDNEGRYRASIPMSQTIEKVMVWIDRDCLHHKPLDRVNL